MLFLPGANGDGRVWSRVAERLDTPAEKVLLDWPGFGRAPRRDDVNSLSDLVGMVLGYVDRPVDIVAQSMGGVIAMQVALQRPQSVERLVLNATSGGVAMRRFNVKDWRPDYMRDLPNAPRWFVDDRTDLSGRLASVATPTLLVYGDADPIAPPAVGEYLKGLLPNAELVIIPGAKHMLAWELADEVAPHIARFLGAGVVRPGGNRETGARERS
jgi:pimeloyl-ACP methyl ester carboxylesterase